MTKKSNSILFWYRYEDDILACFLGSDVELGLFRHFINNKHTSIKITVENEINSTINFLELTIQRQNEQLPFHMHKIYTYRFNYSR